MPAPLLHSGADILTMALKGGNSLLGGSGTYLPRNLICRTRPQTACTVGVFEEQVGEHETTVAGGGGVFAVGDARLDGSTGAMALDALAVAIA